MVISTHVVTPPRIFDVEGGTGEVTRNGNVKIHVQTGGYNNLYLGRFDIAQLLLFASGGPAEALKTLAYVMEHGHRFVDESGCIDDEEPF